jgi:hypothetical protein
MAPGGLAGLKKSQALCQEATRDELLKSLKITLEEALEFNRHDAIAAMMQLPPLEEIIKKNESLYEAKRVDQTSSHSQLPIAIEKANATPGGITRS